MDARYEQVVRRSGLKRTMRWGAESDSDSVVAFRERCSLLTDIGAPLAKLARGAQPPPVHVGYFGAAPLAQSEPFANECPRYSLPHNSSTR